MRMTASAPEAGTDAARLGATVVVSGLAKIFASGGSAIRAVDDVSVMIASGSMVALTGPSGSGKSTLLHLVGAIEAADSGTISVDGQELTRLRGGRLAAYRRTVGFVFQRYHLLPALTALDNVIAPVLPFRVGFNKADRAAELLDAVGLAGRERALPSELSGGQQQRVAVARALIGRPSLLLADEPTGNLDSRTSVEILDLLTELRGRFDMTMLIATHEQPVAARCDRLLRLRDGRLIEDVDLTSEQTPDETLTRTSKLRL